MKTEPTTSPSRNPGHGSDFTPREPISYRVQATFLKAQEGYRAAVIAELDVMLKDARDGRRIRRQVSLVEPQDHIKDYERVVRMLEMSTADEIVVTEQQFSQYVLDEWGWSAQFTASTQQYMGR